MSVLAIGCSHRTAPIEFRERVAFSAAQTRVALERLRAAWPDVEAVLLSTCNRVEFYLAGAEESLPTLSQLAALVADFHDLPCEQIVPQLFEHRQQQAVQHLFEVAASLDSMVVGEPQILSQVKQAYQTATEADRAGPLLHALFQTAVKVARRVATETAIQQRRVSIPSVAVADFAKQIFERFDDKSTLVIGAGEMAEETLRYLQVEGVRDVTVVNRNPERAAELARRFAGRAVAWEGLKDSLAQADLVISTTGATEPIVTLADFATVEARRQDRPLFVLDLAVPRDFAPAIGDRPGVYLYSVDDLQSACARNREARDRELPAARRIVDHEAERFMVDSHHRATGPVIRRLQEGWQKYKDDELRRLFNKLPELDERSRGEIQQAFNRLLNKLLHPPLESLRDEARNGMPNGLLDALARLFQLKD